MNDKEAKRVNVSWGARPESQAACAVRLSLMMKRFKLLMGNGGAWRTPKGFLADLEPSTIATYLKYRRNDGGQLVEDMGFTKSFHLMNGKLQEAFFTVSFGGWSRLGNVATIQLGFDLTLEKHFQRQAMIVLIECFDPDRGRVNSDAASDRAVEKHRAAGLKTPIVIVDWMVYLAGVDIPASELSGVFSVERVGSGTLVILKEDPIDLTNPDDLRLVEAVEPVIRRYLPPDLPRATAVSSKALQ